MKFLILTAITLVSLSAVPSFAASLDFEGLPSTNQVGGTPPANTVLTNNFAGDGIIFGKSGLSAGVVVSPLANSQGTNGVLGLTASGQIPSSAFGCCSGDIYFSFVDPTEASRKAVTNMVSFVIGDDGGDIDNWTVSAFGPNGGLLQSQNVSGSTYQSVTFNIAGIHEIIVDFSNADFGYGLDELMFNTPVAVSGPAPVPLPAALPLMTSGFGAIALIRARRSQS